MILSAIRGSSLDRLADAVLGRGLPLASLWLDGDGAYQTRSVPLSRLNDEVVAGLSRSLWWRRPDEFPHLRCAWGRARVGSTALANLFGTAGLPSFYQPIKAILRHALVGSLAPAWDLPAAREAPDVFIKDVAGPYLLAECLYIPLQLLVEAGYPIDRLHLVMLDRDPLRCFASWLAKWSNRVPRERLLEHFVLASLNAVRVEAYALRHGIPVTHYVHEASREPVPAAAALFDRLGLADRFAPAAVTDWPMAGDDAPANPNVIHPVEPPVYEVPGLHSPSGAYLYRERSAAAVTEHERAVLERFGIPARYRAALAACAADLNLPWLTPRLDDAPAMACPGATAP